MADLISNSVPEQEATAIEDDRREFEQGFDAPAAATTPAALVSEQDFPWADLFVAVLGLIAWFALFCGGILIGTKPFRDQISGSQALEFAAHIKAWYVVVTFWAVTNIGLLACVSALLGAVGRRVGFTAAENEDVVVTEIAQKQVGLYYGCAIMRGFGVYSLVLAGIFVFAADTAASPEQVDYLGIAPLISIAGFYAGYDPVLFSGLLSRAKKIMNALPI